MFSDKIYIRNFSGLANRLEAAAMALYLQKTGEKRIILEWPELDAFSIDGMEAGTMPWWDRLLKSKVLNCHDALPANIEKKRIVQIKAIYGPRIIMRKATRQLAPRLKPSPAIAEGIRETFANFDKRPVVGIHLRRGDFKVSEGEHYLPSANKHVAPPLWWYEAVMKRIIQANPDVAFFIAHNSDETTISRLSQQFTVIESSYLSNYDNQRDGHQSKAHPVADLLALACCRVVVATPYSSFSHWAANILGDDALTILPFGDSTPENPMIGVGFFRENTSLDDWNDISRDGTGLSSFDDYQFGNFLAPPSLQWLP